MSNFKKKFNYYYLNEVKHLFNHKNNGEHKNKAKQILKLIGKANNNNNNVHKLLKNDINQEKN